MPNIVLRFYVFLILTACLLSAPASALPIFAHRYGYTCGQCHTTVPNLNGFGRYFLRHGFRLPGGENGTLPLAIKTQATYTSSDVPKTIVDEVEFLSAGSIGRNASYYLEQYAVDGGLPGRARDMWIDLAQPFGSDPSAPAAHLRLGEFTLPLPVDPETQRPTLSSYALYEQSVGRNTFTLFDPRAGADVYYTDDRHGVESHLVFAQAVDRGSGLSPAGVDVMGTFSKTLGNDVSAYAYRYQGHRATGAVEDRFARDGYALAYQHRKVDFVSLLQRGYDTSADGDGLRALPSGGFIQAGWHFSDALTAYARYDETSDPFQRRRTRATISIVTRPQRNMRFTLEGSRLPDRSNQIGAGLLFAY